MLLTFLPRELVFKRPAPLKDKWTKKSNAGGYIQLSHGNVVGLGPELNKRYRYSVSDFEGKARLSWGVLLKRCRNLMQS